MLSIGREEGEELVLCLEGKVIASITVGKIGHPTKLWIEALPSVRIYRREVFDKKLPDVDTTLLGNKDAKVKLIKEKTKEKTDGKTQIKK